MNIFDEITDFKFKNSSVTLGKFDGIHIGHQKLIQDMMTDAGNNGYETVLFSFDTSGINNQKSLTTKEERSFLCEKYNIDNVIFYPANSSTMAIEPENFIADILAGRLDARLVVIGEDFRFGRGRRGDIRMLDEYSRKYNYELIVEKSVSIDGVKASSTNIKEYIKEGRLEKANEMLGYSYFVMGNVVKGDQIGRTIGTRTVNVIPDYNKLILPNGVYKTKALIDGVGYKSITNVGLCPTVRADDRITVETHIFDFDMDVYDKNVKIEFEKFIREEKKFGNMEALKKQILLDISEANL